MVKNTLFFNILLSITITHIKEDNRFVFKTVNQLINQALLMTLEEGLLIGRCFDVTDKVNYPQCPLDSLYRFYPIIPCLNF